MVPEMVPAKQMVPGTPLRHCYEKVNLWNCPMVPQADLALAPLTVRGLRKLLKTLVPEAGVEPA